MGYCLNQTALDQWIQSLWQLGEVVGPTVFKNQGAFSDTDLVTYGPIHSGTAIEWHRKSYLSPKQYVFPIRETLFHFEHAHMIVPELEEKPIFVLLRACDINGIDRLDTMFLENGGIVDPYYKRRRERLIYLLMDCEDKGFDSCFCVSMKTNRTERWHVSLQLNEAGVSMIINEALESESHQWQSVKAVLTANLESLGLRDERQLPYVVETNNTVVHVPERGAIQPDLFDHEIWTGYTQRCIACGRCNTSCITCSCFTMQDVAYSEVLGERRRRWASCHVKGYSDMAGGHSFRQKNGEKMRFKTMHKIDDYNRRFGKHMCVGCGRCDDVCPEYISFSKTINKLNEIIQLKAGVTHDK